MTFLAIGPGGAAASELGREPWGDEPPFPDGFRDDLHPDWDAPVPDDVDLVTEVATMMAVFAAQQYARVDRLRLNALADASPYGGAIAQVVERSVRLELAAALRITEHAAGALLARAEALVHRYPAALDALDHARITERHAEVLVDLLEPLAPDVRDRVSGRALELAEELPVGSFRRALRHLVEVEESATLTARHESALQLRRVLIEPGADGMSWLHAFLPSVEAHAIHGRITGMAKVIAGHPEEERTLDQVRADVLGDLLIEGTMAAHPDEARGIRASVAVTVPVLALLSGGGGEDDDPGDGAGRDVDGDAATGSRRVDADAATGSRRVDADAARHARGRAPATVEGIGPIPLGQARELCGGDEAWMRVLTHPETGMVLSVGRTQYRPPPSLRRLIKWRSERCMAPGCGVPAARCEIDHNIAWEHGGPTSLDNHAPLCTGHHTIKHHGGWTVEHLPDQGGALLWTSPTGRRYLVKPERAVPVFRPSNAGSADAPF